MCTAISLPHGLVSWWTLGRPMGVDTFRAEFREPMVMVLAGDFHDETHMTYAAACFRSFLLIAAILGTSVEMLFNVYVLTCMRSYCNGVRDEQLTKEWGEIQEEIDRWCD